VTAAKEADAPRPERVTLTAEERDALHHAGDIHGPDTCDCSAYVVECGFTDDDCCAGLLDTFDAVEAILAAREQALRDEIAGEIEAADAVEYGHYARTNGHHLGLRHAARIARGQS